MFSIFIEALTRCQTTSFGFQSSFFLVQAGLDWCQCVWPALLIQVAGPDNALTLGSGTERVECGQGSLQKEKTETQPVIKGITIGCPNLG